MTIRQSVADASYSRCITATASDTVSQSTGPSDAIIFLTTGTATVVDGEGNTVVFTAQPAGTRVPLHVARVNATGLTAVIGCLYY